MDTKQWEQFQLDRIKQAIAGSDDEVKEGEFQQGVISGVWYTPRKVKPQRAVLVVHGMFGNKHSSQVFARRLARYNFFVVCVDLPSHYKNKNKLTIGAVADVIHASVAWIQKRGFAQVAVIGHSMGAIGTIFACAGYTSTVEQRIYDAWESLQKRVTQYEAWQTSQDTSGDQAQGSKEFLDAIEKDYQTIKNIIFDALKQNMSNSVNCYILLALPISAKSFFPVLPLLSKLPQRLIRLVVNKTIHKSQLKRVMKEGNKINYDPAWEEKEAVMWQNFKLHDAHAFLQYMLELKEPTDYLTLIKDIQSFSKKDNMTTFFDYYYRKYILDKPKYILFGKYDYGLNGIRAIVGLKGKTKDLERFYASLNPIKVEKMDVNHIFTEEKHDHSAILGGTSKELAIKVIQFLTQPRIKWR